VGGSGSKVHVAFGSGGKPVVAYETAAGEVRLVSGKGALTVADSGPITALAVDGERIAFATLDGRIRLALARDDGAPVLTKMQVEEVKPSGHTRSLRFEAEGGGQMLVALGVDGVALKIPITDNELNTLTVISRREERLNLVASKKSTIIEGAEAQAKRECEALLSNPPLRSSNYFREPVQGNIISKFGPKEDGSFNDGINYSVPKGTPVKAAESGVVAYAGDELSGFGNLILIRHSDGFVTAYAHNDELIVKRCDVVERGQSIATEGATGGALKPQLHFELRQDTLPVNPEWYFSLPVGCQTLDVAQQFSRLFLEPVRGKLVSKFGFQEDGSLNDGINYSVPKGTPVKAAESGVIAYVGDEPSGLGLIVLIRHSAGFMTVYAHNDEVMVKSCDVVKRGQTIAKSGATGKATEPQLHFELRKNGKPIDPKAYFQK
jgi:murein DD-endopeptidase MepM/ murein hydrolase activator NlpD